MRTTNKDPESLDKLNPVEITDSVKEFVKDLSQRILEEKTARATWEQNVDRWRALRYGIRSEKNHPWPKCANYVMPLIDSDISRLKPAYSNLINISPAVSYEPFGPEDVAPGKKREQLFDWLLKVRGNFYENYILGIDYLLEQGMVVFKITWKYSTRNYTIYIDLTELPEDVLAVLYDPRVTDEMLYKIIIEEYKLDDSFEENVEAINKGIAAFRSGKTNFELLMVEKKDDYVEIVPLSVREEVLFPLGTTDLNDARFIDEVFPMSINDLKIAMRDGKFQEYPDETIESWATVNQGSDYRAYRKTYQYLDKYTEIVWLHQTCVWHDINDDGIDERCIVTWPDNEPQSVLRFIELPYEHGMWPYVLVRREINDSGPYASRGIPALNEDFQNGISTSVNQAIDNGTLTNTPQVVVRANTLVNPRNLRYTPGNVVETLGPTTDYELRQLGNASQGFLFQQAQYLKSWADQRTGNLTSGLSEINNLQGQGQGGKKTAKEINTVEFLSGQSISLDLFVFQMQMAKVYYQADALYNQFAEEDEVAMIIGGKPLTISRREIQGKFNIVPNGKMDNTNPQLRLQKSWLLLQAFANDPDIKQRELKKLILDNMDVKLADLLFKSDEELAQEQQQMMLQVEAQKQKAVNEMLNIRTLNDDMDIRKAALLQPIEGAKYAPG